MLNPEALGNGRTLAAPSEPRSLRQAFGCFPSGVAAVCGTVDGVPRGIAVSSYTSVSLDPPLVSICIDRNSTTWPFLRIAPRLGLSILAESHADAGRQLAAKVDDRFAGLSMSASDAGALFLEGAAAWFDCSIHQEIAAGDHEIVLLQVHAMHADPGTSPLVFHGSRFRRLAIAS